MNKTELIDKIAAGAEISKAQAKAALDATTNALKEALIAGDKIQLVGFGTFSVNGMQVIQLSMIMENLHYTHFHQEYFTVIQPVLSEMV